LLKDKNILITGGCGFIGSCIAKTLVSENDVKILDNLSSGRLENIAEIRGRVEMHSADIRGDISSYFEGIDVVFHEAANVFIQKSIDDPHYDASVNISGTLNILEACRKHDVGRVVYASSSAVYGDPVGLPIREDHPLHPKVPYGVSKMLGEQYCRVYHELYGLETVSLRHFNVYGPNQRADSPYSGVIAIFINNALHEKPLTIYGDGSQIRDFVNVKDVVSTNIAAATSKKAVGKAINVGTGVQTSLHRLVDILSEIAGKKLDIVYAPARAGDIKNSVADITLAKDVLGFVPNVSLKEGLSELYHMGELNKG